MTAKANQPALDQLRELLDAAAATLPDVHRRKMFGWPTLFSDRGIFALVSEKERIGVRLPDSAAFAESLAIPGADTWQFEQEPNPIKHWVLLPVSFHHDPELLEQWVRRAYDLSLTQKATKRRRSKLGCERATEGRSYVRMEEKTMLSLVRPSIQYRDNYLEALREFQAEGSSLSISVASLRDNFASFVQDILDEADPAKLKPGKVPAVYYWLIDNGEYIGQTSIRHPLNQALRQWGGHIGYRIRPSRRRRGYGEEILRLTLLEARRMGLPRVMLTCYADNIGSKKIIEGGGGVLDSEVQVDGKVGLRYWIDLL
jgi:predicted acetyltransferase/TfoX/Sxy family transcriptional regulator of competence genes